MHMVHRYPRHLTLAVAATLMILIMGCSIKVQKKALHEPEDLAAEEGLDGKSPWLKAHLPDGGLYLLADWKVDEAARTISGEGSLMNARRDVLASGPLSVSLDSVAIFESNRIQTSPAVAGLTILTVASGALTAYCIANPKACFGSCPTFYAADESGTQILMAEGFSASIAPALEDNDLDALFRATASGREFTVTMTNEALETHVVRRADLLVTPRPPGGKTLAMEDGTWRQARDFQTARQCVGPEGDCTDLLAVCDGEERFSLADSFYLGAKEYLELEFETIPAGELGLVIASRHSLLSTYLFYQGLAFLGENAAGALVSLENSVGSQPGSEAMGNLLGKIEVQVPEPDGTWRTVGTTGETGPLAVNVHTLSLPRLDPDNPRLRLCMTKGNWRLDHVALAVLADQVTPERLSPSFVLRDGAPDPEALAQLTDEDFTLITLPGDKYELVYRLPNDHQEWDVYLDSRGYYLEWMRNEWLNEEDPIQAAMMFRYPELALSYLAPKFKALEPEMETAFWGSRYAR